jgi:vancomycin resistance protein YoaR
VIDDGAVAHAMASFARPATSGPIRLVLGRHEVKVASRVYSPAITMAPDGARLKPMLDVEALVKALKPVSSTVPGRPVRARIVVDGGRPRVIPSKKGVVFDRADLQRKFLAAVARPAGQRRVAIKGATASPTFTTAEARRLRVKERVATFTTRFAYAGYRNTNLARGAALLDGTLLKPGQTFSFNKAVGRPSVARGFVPGYVISGGGFTEDVDRGLSQLATTTYNAMFFAGLKDVEHEVHTVFSARFPKGRVATVDYGKSDLRFTNDSPYGVLITARVTPSSQARDGTVTVSMWSTKRWAVTARTGRAFAKSKPSITQSTKASCEAAAGSAGFSVHVTRVFRRPGHEKVMRTERHTAVYGPSDTVVCATP